MIISNFSPLIYLARIGKLEILEYIFRRVIIPKAVFNEVVERGEAAGFPDAKIIRKATEEWIEVKELNKEEKESCEYILKMAPLGLGEAEAISLAKSMRLPIIVDDKIANRVAKLFRIESHWTIHVIFRALRNKTIKKNEAKRIIEDLVETGLRIKPEVLLGIMKQLE